MLTHRIMKKALFIGVWLIASSVTMAQSERKTFYSLSGSADFGRFQDRLELTPSVSFLLLPKTYLGIGLSTSYYSNETSVYSNNNQKLVESKVKDVIWYWGGELFIRFHPFENQATLLRNCFLQSSFETLKGNGRYKEENGTYSYHSTHKTAFAGIGYKQPLNERISLGLLLSFKLNNEKNSIYRNPIFRLSFEF